MSLNGGNIHAGGIFFQSEDKKNGAGIRAVNVDAARNHFQLTISSWLSEPVPSAAFLPLSSFPFGPQE